MKGLSRILAAAAVVAVANAVSAAPSPSPTRAPFKAFALYALSRGKGVPQGAEDALARVRKVVESDRERGVALKLETKPFGLEGETRLCVEYGSAEDAARAFEQAESIVKGVDLARLVIEGCANGPRRDGPKQEVKP